MVDWAVAPSLPLHVPMIELAIVVETEACSRAVWVSKSSSSRNISLAIIRTAFLSDICVVLSKDIHKFIVTFAGGHIGLPLHWYRMIRSILSAC